MAHVPLPDGVPGIVGLFMFRPETAGPLNALAEVLLRGDSTLTRGERELIAAYVSRLNACTFCCESHSTFAALQLDGGADLVDDVLAGPADAAVTPKLRALLDVAGAVQVGGPTVTDELIAEARSHGATDVEIHDTVLIAAAFCMFNRYVDGLGTPTPDGPEAYLEMGRMIVEHGYTAPVPG